MYKTSRAFLLLFKENVTADMAFDWEQHSEPSFCHIKPECKQSAFGQEAFALPHAFFQPDEAAMSCLLFSQG